MGGKNESLFRSRQGRNWIRHRDGHHDLMERKSFYRVGDYPWIFIVVVCHLLRRDSALSSARETPERAPGFTVGESLI